MGLARRALRAVSTDCELSRPIALQNPDTLTTQYSTTKGTVVPKICGLPLVRQSSAVCYRCQYERNHHSDKDADVFSREEPTFSFLFHYFIQALVGPSLRRIAARIGSRLRLG
jgi:hypothetical protein